MASQNPNQVANKIGQHAYYEMVGCVTVSLCYGVCLSLFYVSLRVSSGNHERTPKARKFLIALTCLMFLINTGVFITFLCEYFVLFAWAFDNDITGDTPSLQDRLLASNIAAAPYYAALPILEIINYAAGDAIVLWRAAVLWPHSCLVRSGLLFLLLGDIGYSLYDIVNMGRVALGYANADTSSWVSKDAIRILVSLGVNFLATLCIAIKAWHFRRTLRLGFSKAKTKKSFVYQILILMIECGLIFCAVQLFYAIFTLLVVPQSWVKPPTSSFSLFQSALSPCFSLFAGMYPCLVIVMMGKQRSIWGTSTFVAGSHLISPDKEAGLHESRPLSVLQFATPSEPTAAPSHSQSISLQASSNDGTVVTFTSDAGKEV